LKTRSTMTDLPSGTVTLLFTDIEGSTKLLQELGERYEEVLAEHRRAMRKAFAEHDGVEVDTQGDAFFVAFARASDAIAAAEALQGEVEDGPVRVRVGIHTGEPIVTEDGYVGMDVHRAARIMSAGHGGQVLMSQSTGDLVDIELRDLGEHRLKDLAQPVRLFQLGAADFPPLRTLYGTNLPIQPTALVGRERELAEAGALLGEQRVLTLIGPGGSGKTRLALQLAAEASEQFPDGVYWVPLQALRDPTLVVPTIAQAVGGKNGLVAEVGDKRMLLLLDNLEHMLEAAPQVAEVLREVPNLTLLATSREPLGIRGEHHYQIEPLPPDDAVALFLERARAVNREFELSGAVREICRRLDGLPLALELAAGRASVLSPDQILVRLGQTLPLLTGGARDAPERQRTLRATIEWSFELLAAPEQQLFPRLAVFAGSFDLETAEHVAEADLDTLQSLVQKNLVRRWGSGRFGLLETIREYALEQLESTAEAHALRERHARHYLTLAEEAEPQLRGASQRDWIERLSEEHDNLRSALAWLGEHGPEEQLRLAGLLGEYWWVRGHGQEGARWLEDALGRASDAPTLPRAKALAWASNLLGRTGFPDKEIRLAEESLAVARAVGDERTLTRSLIRLGNAALHQENFVRARSALEEGRAIAERLDDRSALAWTAHSLAGVAADEGDYDQARALLEESVALWRELDIPGGVANALCDLGFVVLQQDIYDQARACFGDSLRGSSEVGWTETAAYCLLGFGAAAAFEGFGEPAARLLGAAFAARDSIGIRFDAKVRELGERAADSTQARLGEERFAAVLRNGEEMSLDEAIAYALEGAKD
jgi:predicted ATPase/class 3 adenylate cyclase